MTLFHRTNTENILKNIYLCPHNVARYSRAVWKVVTYVCP